MSTPNDGRRADFNDGGGGRRRDYGPRGVCGGIVLGAATVTVAMVTLLAKAVRR